MNAPTPPLSALGLTGGYRKTEVLHDISLTATPGEVLGLLGPNGAGKTTLLRILSGVHAPWSGRVLLGERPLSSFAPRERAKQIAFVPQGVTIPVPFTVADVVAMGRLPYTSGWARLSDDDETAIAKALDDVGLGAKANTSIHDLSAGEQQRALLALALAQQPRVLLLDEPTAHLDLHHAWNLMRLVGNLAREQQLVVILTTHDLTLAAETCTRLALLEKGRLAAEGSREHVLRSDLLTQVYAHPLAVTIADNRWWIHPAGAATSGPDNRGPFAPTR
ncbi:MAG: ABC transporter ATP-binding protein [Kiritimatiellae bacterium]|nr:ABC transporter ATP-binding protein [Kiritimatiellia bacterium]